MNVHKLNTKVPQEAQDLTQEHKDATVNLILENEKVTTLCGYLSDELESAREEIELLRNALQVTSMERDEARYQVTQLRERHHRMQSRGNAYGLSDLMREISARIPLNGGKDNIILFSQE